MSSSLKCITVLQLLSRKKPSLRKRQGVTSFYRRGLSKQAGQLARTLWVPGINDVTQWARENSLLLTAPWGVLASLPTCLTV